MTGFTSTVSHACPEWLTATLDESFPSDWTSVVRACLEAIEARFNASHPERVEVFFDVARGKLQIYSVTFPAVSWMDGQSLKEITKHHEAFANEGKWLHKEATEDSATTGFGSPASPVAEDPTSANSFCTTDCELEESPSDQHGLEVKAVQAGRGESRPFLVFRGLSVKSSTEAAGETRDDDTNKRLQATMRRLRERGTMRPLTYPAPDWPNRLEAIERDFPNFGLVIQTVIRPHLGLLSRGCAHRMVPTLLVGEPGVGKTQFAREIQSILGVPSLLLVMAEETNGSGLSGSSSFWSNASPGKLFEEMAWGNGRDPVANPLVILDEVDKVSANRYDPLAGLYSLLEVETAARFKDQAVPGVSLDLSNVRFILTANDENEIPAPLRSRVRTFHIDLPDADGMKRIAQRMFESLLAKYNLDLNPQLPGSVLDDILGIGPRESKIRLEAAIAIAAANEQKELDLVSWRQTDSGAGAKSRRMGFL